MTYGKLTVEIDLKGALLLEPGPERDEELARILTNTASKVAGGRVSSFLLDLNGNTVGHYLIIEED